MTPGLARWLPAQRHIGENIGDTESHVVFVELKQPTLGADESAAAVLGPADANES
jgi:hypothetical protein